jgi:hypothetical protein
LWWGYINHRSTTAQEAKSFKWQRPILSNGGLWIYVNWWKD